jgi:hypothetical protein
MRKQPTRKPNRRKANGRSATGMSKSAERARKVADRNVAAASRAVGESQYARKLRRRKKVTAVIALFAVASVTLLDVIVTVMPGRDAPVPAFQIEQQQVDNPVEWSPPISVVAGDGTVTGASTGTPNEADVPGGPTPVDNADVGDGAATRTGDRKTDHTPNRQ